jgi:predicted GIY-YIG superfamily endonuclease
MSLFYALQEVDGNHSYVGVTNNFTRRLREHNGIVKNRGARYTRRKVVDPDRPNWTPIFKVKGFTQRRTALQFEKMFHRGITVPKTNPFGSGSSARRAWHLYWALKKERFSTRDTVPTKDLSLVIEWSRTDFYTIATTHLLDWGPAIVEHACAAQSS